MDMLTCKNCNAVLIEKTGKKGKFYTCPNWKKDGSGCEGDIWFPPHEKPQEFKKAIPSLITTEELDHKLGIIRGDILKVQNKLEAMEKVLNNIEAQIIAKSIKWISGD